jgi:hypothetical protein
VFRVGKVRTAGAAAMETRANLLAPREANGNAVVIYTLTW